jgi:hypothetical protein
MLSAVVTAVARPSQLVIRTAKMEQCNPLAHTPPSTDKVYYNGINRDWTLLASTTRDNPFRQTNHMDAGFREWSLKSLACVGAHAIVPIWETLVRTITPLNTDNAWRVLGCYRIGNKAIEDVNKPVVVLLHVRAGMLSSADAQALAARIAHEYYKL